MNILIASDSFKGSLNTLEVADNIKIGIKRVFPEAECKILPIADGGEGTMLVMHKLLGGDLITIPVMGPNHGKVMASYLLTDYFALIEMAQASGLHLMEGKLDILNATTYGTGELIRDAIIRGSKKIIIGIGGSATNDGGIGMATALGIKFLKNDNKPIKIGSSEIHLITSIDTSELIEEVKTAEITIMCDVNNPLFGEHGATYCYGKQKGGKDSTLAFLDNSLKHLSCVCATIYPDYSQCSGSGAAGGLGFGLMTFLGGKPKSGIDLLLDISNFNELLSWSDIVFTGEGKIDFQSANGKVISGIAKRSKKQNKPVIAIVGAIGEGAKKTLDIGITSIESCTAYPCDISEAIKNTTNNIQNAAERSMRHVKLGIEISSKI